MIRFDRKLVQGATIHLPPASAPALQFAAAELQHYLQRMAGGTPSIAPTLSAAQPNTLRITTPGSAHDALPERAVAAPLGAGDYAVVADSNAVALSAGSPRAGLDAAYAVLKRLGCRWSLHGSHEETVPPLDDNGVALQSFEERPRFRLRGYCTDIMTFHYTQPEHLHDRLEDDRAFIDWMGKSGANTFFYIRHPFDSQLTIPELSADFERRGIDVEYGGHVMPLLLPRELFAQHPEYFPAAPDGQRSDQGNLCTSNRGALATVSSNAGQYVRDFPEMQALHIWGADLWKGGWCHCLECRGVSVQDQSLRACNAVARGLAAAGMPRPVCYLAYHDTLDANLKEIPDNLVVCEFAPRERCYGHPLDDAKCTTNRRYAAALERYVERFDGRVRLFEYYGDAILFFGCAVPLTEVIAADLAYYSRLGIRDILMLQFGSFSVWSYPLNHLAFAAATAGHSAAGLVDGYCQRFAAHAAVARNAFIELEAIMRRIVRYGDIRLRPRRADAAKQLQAALENGLPRLAQLATALEATEDEALHAAAQLLRYTQTVLGGVGHELQTGAPADTIYVHALQLLEAVDRRFKGLWGSVDLPIIHSFYAAASYSEATLGRSDEK
jgi:hypothetical protein